MKKFFKPFFCTKATGVNADIERHTVEENRLIAKIEELEESSNPWKESYLKSYRNILDLIRSSKLNATSKLGKNNGNLTPR